MWLLYNNVMCWSNYFVIQPCVLSPLTPDTQREPAQMSHTSHSKHSTGGGVCSAEVTGISNFRSRSNTLS